MNTSTGSQPHAWESHGLEAVWRDVRMAFRMLRRAPTQPASVMTPPRSQEGSPS